MSRMFSEEEIAEYIRDGWTFRVKKVKGRKYITRRKGQKERGLGLFTPVNWKLISSLLEKTESKEEILEEDKTNARAQRQIEGTLKKIDDQLQQERGAVMMKSCYYVDDALYCLYWNFEKKPAYFKTEEELFGSPSTSLYKRKKIIFGGKMSSRWVYRASPWFCSKCTAYISPKIIETINKESKR